MRTRPRTVIGVVAAGAAYFVLACLLYWPVAPLDASHLAGCACGDPEQQTWFLAWTSFALTHGHNPFLTSYLHAPLGANLAIDTSMPLLGLIGLPITLTAGPVAAFNLLLRLGLAASGASMFGVMRRYTSWWPAAFGGGLLFVISPYVANQAIRHLFLSFVPLVPLFIPLLDDWLISRRRSPARSGVLLGLVAAAQFLISAEVLLTSAIMAVIGLAYLALRYRAAVAERVGVLVRGAGAATGVFLAIAAYPVWMLLAGPYRPIGPVHTLSGLTRYHGDLLSPLYPTSHQAIAPGVLGAVGDRLATGLTIEDGFYLGFPLLLLLGYLVFRCRRVPLVATAAVVGVAAYVLGLGAQLTVNGKNLGVPLPFAVLRHLPVVQNLEAARFSLYIQLAAAIIFAVGLDRVRAWGWLPAAARSRGGPALAQAGAFGPGSAATETAALNDSTTETAALPGAATAEAAGPAAATETSAPAENGARTAASVPAAAHPSGPGGAPVPGTGRRASPAVVVAVGLIAMLPLLPHLPLPTAPAHIPSFFSGRNARNIPSGAVALTLPFDLAPQNDPMLWQAVSEMRFRILGGDAFVRNFDGRTTWHWQPAGPKVLLQVLRAGRYLSTPPPPMTPAAVAAVRQLLARDHISAVLVDQQTRDGAALAVLMTSVLQALPEQHGRMDVWLNVQRDLRRHPG